MKATRKGKIKQKYGFEAPIFPAKASKNENYEINDIETNFNIYSMLKGNIRDYFLVRVNGESMQDIGISDGDTLVVNSKINALSNDIVIASLNGELLVKTLKIIDCHAVDEQSKMPVGSIVSVKKGLGFTVKCGEGCLLITKVQPESKSQMAACDFLNGSGLSAGSLLR